jgi:hypothetical protein
MRIGRITALSLSICAFAVLGAGCQGADTAAAAKPDPNAAAKADNRAEICDDFRHIEVSHHNDTGDLKTFNAAIAADLTSMAARATDPTITAQLRAVSAQYTVLADQIMSAKDLDQVEKANPAVFTAGNQAWVDLESRCGKALIPTP